MFGAVIWLVFPQCSVSLIIDRIPYGFVMLGGTNNLQRKLTVMLS